MKLEELYILYHTTNDLITSVHTSRTWAENALEELGKYEKQVTIVATLEEGIKWEIQAATSYGDSTYCVN